MATDYRALALEFGQIHGERNLVPVSNMDYIEMEPRTWYPIPAGSSVQNRHNDNLLVTLNPTYWAADMNNPTFAEMKNRPMVWVIHPNETKLFNMDAYIMSSYYRLQPIDTMIFGEFPDMGSFGQDTTTITGIDSEWGTYINTLDPTDPLIGTEIRMEQVVESDGDVVTKFYNKNNEEINMTTGNFTKAQATSSVVKEELYDTLASGVVERVEQFRTVTIGTDGASTIGTAAYKLLGTDTDYTVSGTLAQKPQKVLMEVGTVQVTGTTGVALPLTVTATNSQGQAFPQSAVVQVNADTAAGGNTAGGIAYTTNGVAPTEGTEFEVSTGQPINLDSNDEIVNFLAVPLNANGDIDGTLLAELTFETSNIGEDKDDI